MLMQTTAFSIAEVHRMFWYANSLLMFTLIGNTGHQSKYWHLIIRTAPVCLMFTFGEGELPKGGAVQGWRRVKERVGRMTRSVQCL